MILQTNTDDFQAFFTRHLKDAGMLNDLAVGRCASFVAVNLTDTVGPELQRLYGSPDTGPLACLVIAEPAKPR